MKRLLPLLLLTPALRAATLLVEAEHFRDHGGWVIDTQFVETMGSPYLMAHGLGVPVKDAVTEVTVPAAGTYRVWARTQDWVAKFKAEGAPGRFQVLVNGRPLPQEFGTRGAQWHWQDGGTVALPAGAVTLALRDLTGFNGRCDALVLSSEAGYQPDNTNDIMPAWRRQLLGIADAVQEEGPFELVVVGGGYAGTGAAISAARMGIPVALIQNRGVLGGNGSSEIRVWAQGNTPPGLYPVGDIINEFSDRASSSPGRAEEFGDDKKLAIVRAEPNLSLFLHHHFYAVEKDGDRIRAVRAFDVKTGQVRRFTARTFVDCTGHGFLGLKAGADHRMEEKERMGMSNMWRWKNEAEAQPFPEVPWALQLYEQDFPYPRRGHAEWFWESGFDRHPIDELEYTRDLNLRAAFGAFSAMKKGAYAKMDATGKAHANARLEWLAFVGGTRETLQLLGDVVLSEEDIIQKRKFPDATVLTTWSIDLHYAKEQYAKRYPQDPFISYAKFGEHVDRKHGYPVPYRTFYSRNIPNLFMAGRNISVTHEALGTVRVMRTLGMVGVVVGKAAAICAEKDCLPRDVYEKHLDRLIELCKLPGGTRRATIRDPFIIAESPKAVGGAPDGQSVGIPAAQAGGIVVDNRQAELVGSWLTSTHTSGYIGSDYLHDEGKGKGEKSITWPVKVPTSGLYRVNFSFRPGGNRSPRVPVVVRHGFGDTTVHVNQQESPVLDHGFAPLGEFMFKADQPGFVRVNNAETSGIVIVDAIQLVPVKK
jgi:hypothetical protein